MSKDTEDCIKRNLNRNDMLDRGNGQSLYDIYMEILKDRSWFYYTESKTEICDQNDPVAWALQNPTVFIYNYFQTGGKSTLLLRDYFDARNTDSRMRHVISSYFLGIWLREQIPALKKSLDQYLEHACDAIHEECMQSESPTIGGAQFLYIWFMSCLYHDMGYVIEDSDTMKGSVRKLRCKVFDTLNGSCNNSSLPKSPGDMVPTTLFSGYRNYFRMCTEKGEIFRQRNCLDHGISAGILLYKLMKENYENKKEEKGTRKDSFEFNNLLWSQKLLDTLVSQAAWAIIAHNIWLLPTDAEDKKKRVYEEYGLKDLIRDDPLIEPDKHPLLFLLCLVDSLEPLKRDDKIDKLKDIYISFSDDAIHVCNHPNKSLDLSFLGYKTQESFFR